MTNPKLRKLFSKGPNYRENKIINYHKRMNEVKNSVDNLIDSMTTKYKLSPRTFDDWKNKVFERVAAKIRKLKSIGKPKQAKPILKDEDVVQYLGELHNNFVIVPIDKAANRFFQSIKQTHCMRI